MAKAHTRTRILEAALACFAEDGYEQTTVARIRARSSVSNGALFHHFRSKEAIADALYVQAIASFQEGVWELVRRRPRSLRAAVRRVIAHQLAWIEQHPDLARLVYRRGHLDWDSPAVDELPALNRGLAAAFREWMAPRVRAGEIRQTSMLMISAIVGGPAHAVARRWLAGQLSSPPGAYLDELADAAWAGLSGTVVRSRPDHRESPQRRVRVELLSGNGQVLARGEAPLEPHPHEETGG
jgi:AcrR family transcriptional regulator